MDRNSLEYTYFSLLFYSEVVNVLMSYFGKDIHYKYKTVYNHPETNRQRFYLTNTVNLGKDSPCVKELLKKGFSYGISRQDEWVNEKCCYIDEDNLDKLIAQRMSDEK